MKHLIKLLTFSVATALILSSCEGPMGLAGQDANESCKECHNSTITDKIAIQYEHSLHFEGEAYEQGTRNNCAPCHSHQGFLDVVTNNTPATITPTAADPTRFTNNYIVSASELALPGPISCFTCHSALHTTYTTEDFFPLTTTAAVPMTMYGGTKTINFAKANANLCAKCHQPRPVTAASGNVINYATLVSAPTATYNLSSIGYRTGVHYGTQAAMAAGMGAVEFGTGYTQSAHVATASCASCHMATPAGLAGGHSFSAAGNFNGCNVSGCHTTPMSATNATYTTAVSTVTTKLAQLATKINALGGANTILMRDPIDNQFHGYFNIYDATANPTGFYRNPTQGNVALPALTNAQFGAVINFQLIARGAGKGIHNFPYINKLLDNTLAAW